MRSLPLYCLGNVSIFFVFVYGCVFFVGGGVRGGGGVSGNHYLGPRPKPLNPELQGAHGRGMGDKSVIM